MELRVGSVGGEKRRAVPTTVDLAADHRAALARMPRPPLVGDGRQPADVDGMDVGAALAALAPGDRDVIVLIAWEDLSYEQVAAALDVPVGTVRSRLHRARRQLRAALGDEEAT